MKLVEIYDKCKLAIYYNRVAKYYIKQVEKYPLNFIFFVTGKHNESIKVTCSCALSSFPGKKREWFWYISGTVIYGVYGYDSECVTNEEVTELLYEFVSRLIKNDVPPMVSNHRDSFAQWKYLQESMSHYWKMIEYRAA